MSLIVDYKNLKLVIFDVDGTLYRQKPLRRIMAVKLLMHYALRPWRYRELLLLRNFRKQREMLATRADEDIARNQYLIPAAMAGVAPEAVEQIVQRWMFTAPLPYLRKNVFPEIYSLFKILKERNIKTAVLSDYPAKEKLEALGLKVDLAVSAADAHINCLKPGSKGLSFILNYFKAAPSQCLFIGDRPELDGECASTMDVPFCQIKNNHDYQVLIEMLKVK